MGGSCFLMLRVSSNAKKNPEMNRLRFVSLILLCVFRFLIYTSKINIGRKRKPMMIYNYRPIRPIFPKSLLRASCAREAFFTRVWEMK